jgi:hypothetical protein
MSWLQRQSQDPADGLSAKPRRWPAIVGVTAAAWLVLSGALFAILRFQSGQ